MAAQMKLKGAERLALSALGITVDGGTVTTSTSGLALMMNYADRVGRKNFKLNCRSWRSLINWEPSDSDLAQVAIVAAPCPVCDSDPYYYRFSAYVESSPISVVQDFSVAMTERITNKIILWDHVYWRGGVHGALDLSEIGTLMLALTDEEVSTMKNGKAVRKVFSRDVVARVA